MSRTHVVRLIVTLAFAAGCLVWVLWDVSLVEVGAHMAAVPALHLLGVLALLLLAFGLRVIRYQLLLGDDAPSWRRQVVACGVGFLALNALPFRLGELVRPVYLERDGVPFGASVGAIALERVGDLAALLGMLALSAWVVDVPGTVFVAGIDVLSVGQQVVGTMVAALLAGLVVAAAMGPTLATWIEPVPMVGGPLSTFARRFAQSTQALARRPSVAMAVLVLSAAIWASTVGTVAVLLDAFAGLPRGGGPALFTTAVTIAGAIAVPTPGAFGPFEASCRAALGLYGADPTAATALAAIWHLAIFGFNVGLGALLAGADGVSVMALVRQGREEHADVA